MKPIETIDLRTPLSFRSALLFPLQNPTARAEVVIGGLWLLVPVVGWLLNMGHRISMTHRMQHGLPAWPAWTHYGALFRHGCITFLGMVEYHAPAVIVDWVAWRFSIPSLHVLAAALWILATLAVPGYMSHYCFTLDPREVFDPFRALRRAFQGGRDYWLAWSIALTALVLSFSGLLVFGFGFLLTSVWFWQVAGFAFATAFTRVFALRPG
jgi:hypothetical protein